MGDLMPGGISNRLESILTQILSNQVKNTLKMICGVGEYIYRGISAGGITHIGGGESRKRLEKLGFGDGCI